MTNKHETHVLYTPKDFSGDEKQSKLGRMVIIGGLKACKKCDGTADELFNICKESEQYHILKSNPSDTDLAKQIIDLQKTKARLTNLLVVITHQEGALEECKDLWLPVVQNELKLRSK